MWRGLWGRWNDGGGAELGILVEELKGRGVVVCFLKIGVSQGSYLSISRNVGELTRGSW